MAPHLPHSQAVPRPCLGCPLPRSASRWEQNSRCFDGGFEPRDGALCLRGSPGRPTWLPRLAPMLCPLRSHPWPSRREEPRGPQTTLVGELAQCGDGAHGSAEDRHGMPAGRPPTPASGGMTLGALTNLSEPQSPYLQNGDKSSPSPPRGCMRIRRDEAQNAL